MEDRYILPDKYTTPTKVRKEENEAKADSSNEPDRDLIIKDGGLEPDTPQSIIYSLFILVVAMAIIFLVIIPVFVTPVT